jgi:hypothetical protein
MPKSWPPSPKSAKRVKPWPLASTISAALSAMRGVLAPLEPEILKEVTTALPRILHLLIHDLRQKKKPMLHALPRADRAAPTISAQNRPMTKHERELIRLMYQQRVEEGRNQQRLIENLRDSIESVQRMQAAQDEMLKLIGELLELQQDTE